MAESYSVRAILSAQDRNFSSVFKKASSATQALGDQLRSGLGFGALMEVGSRSVGTVIDNLTDLVGEMGDASAAWKTFEHTMRMNNHAEDEIQSVKAELQDFAEKTIYSASDMASTFAQLDAVGIQSVDRLVKGFGGLSAAAESPQQAMKTLSQQATQMAAKPKVAWEDFKLMLEQTPAGIAAVAKYMGKSTQQLIADVQAGTVATEDFFDAISTVGTNDAFTQLATEYKTVGQAVDGLTETVSNKLLPAFDAVSQIGIDAISAVTDKMSSLDGTALAAVITVDNLKSILGTVATLLAGGMAAEGLGALVSTVSEYGPSLADSLNVARGAAGKLSDSLSVMREGIGKISVSSVAKQVNTGLNGIRRGFTQAGTFLDNFGSDVAMSMEAISSRFQNGGLKVWGVFESLGNKLGKTGKDITKPLKNMVKTASGSISGIAERISTIVKPFSGLASGISTGIQKAAGVGVTALSKMSSALVAVMGVAMQTVAPAAIFGLLLVGLGFVNSQFGDEIGQLLQTATEQGPQIITNLVQGVQSKLPAMIQSGAQLLTGFLNAVTANLPAIFSGGVSLIQTLVQGVAQNSGTILPAAIGLVGTLVDGILTALPQLLLTGLDLLKSLSQGIVDNTGLIIDTATNTIENFVNGVVDNLPAILDTGIAILTNLAKGAIQILPQLLIVGINALSVLLSGITQNIQKIMQAGVQIVKMLVSGIVQNLPQILEAAVTALASFLRAVVESLPDIVTGGAQIIVALVTGLIQMLPSIWEAGWNLIKALGSAIVKAIPNVITGAVSGIKTVFGDLWSFITGKTSEGASQVSVTTQAMAGNTATSVSNLSSSVSSSFSGMSTDASTFAKKMESSVTNSATQMGDNVSNSIADMSGDASSLTKDMMGSVTDSISGMNSLGSADMSGLADSIISSAGTANSQTASEMKGMAQSVSSSMQSIQSDTQNAMNRIPTLAKSAMTKFNSALRSGGTQSKSIAKSTATSVVSALGSARSGAYSAGRNVGIGLANGMSSQLGRVRSVARQLASAAEAAIRAEAEIHSPSHVSDQLGVYWGGGYANGIASMARKVWQASEKLVTIPQLAAGPSMSYRGTLSEDYEYTMNAHYTIVVPIEYDGREVARVTAPYTEAELNKRQTRANRKNGIR